MATKAERLGLLSTIATFVVAGVVYGFARWSGSVGALVSAAFLALAVLLAAVSYFHLRLVRRKVEEDLEESGLRGDDADSSLFTAPTEDNLEAFTAEHALRQFERFIVPGFTVVFAVLHLALGFVLMRRIGDAAGIPVDKTPAMLAVLAAVAFIFYVGGKIQAAMADETDYRLLLAPAGYLLLCAAIALLSDAAAVATHFKPARAVQFDTIAAWVGVIVMALLGIEYLITAILESYRPRVGIDDRPLYESRLCELLARPRGLFESIAQAVDYQFGFQVSETWFYQLLRRAVLPLVIVQLLSLYVLSCFAFVGPEEAGIRERFGRPSPQELRSGVHLKFPWPIDTVRKIPAKKALRVEIGRDQGESDEQDHGHEHDRVILWTGGHTHRSHWLMASRGTPTTPADEGAADGPKPATVTPPPADEATTDGGPTTAAAGDDDTTEPAAESVPVNLVSLHAVVQYHIADVYRYEYGFADASQVLNQLAHRVAVKRLVSADLFDLMGAKRLVFADEIRVALQRDADAIDQGRGLGVSIDFVGIENVHPPVAVAKSFEGVLGSAEAAETLRIDAAAYARRSVPLANARKAQVLGEAEGYRAQKELVAQAEAKAFSNHLRAYRAGGKVYRYRAYFDVLERALGPKSMRKYVVTSKNTRAVTILNLEDKLRPDLLDLGATESEEE